jgi:hypothetical protein
VDIVRLYDDGTHGDEAAGDGIYTAEYEGTTVAGTYAFEFNASGRTPSGIPFERNQRLEKHIAARIGIAGADVIRLPAAEKEFDLFEITLRPADDYGNLLGPGRQDLLLWESTAGEFLEPAVDHLDGTYSRRLRLPAGTSAASVDLTVIVGDSPFRVNLGQALSPGHGAPLGVLIGCLVLLAVLFMRMLKNKNR